MQPLNTEPPLLPTSTTLNEGCPLDLRSVLRETHQGRLWNEFIARITISESGP